jgi:hypothetical protein
LLEKNRLIHGVIAFVKNGGNKLGTMVTTLRSIIDCETFKLLRVYQGTCFQHVMSKTCQYVTNDDKVLVGLSLVSVKDVQTSLQKIII